MQIAREREYDGSLAAFSLPRREARDVCQIERLIGAKGGKFRQSMTFLALFYAPAIDHTIAGYFKTMLKLGSAY